MDEVGTINIFKPYRVVLLTFQGDSSFVAPFLCVFFTFHVCLCYAVLSIPCSLVITC